MDVFPVIDMGGSGQNLVMVNYVGIVKIINMNGDNQIGIGLNGGFVILDSTSVSAGSVIVSGIGSLQDENGNYILTGTWNGVTIQNSLINKETIADAVWDEPLLNHTDETRFGAFVKTLLKTAEFFGLR
jgi:hypothetical protein